MVTVEQHLAQAERHVTEAEERIRQQEQRIAELHRDRHDTTQAEALLKTYYDILDGMRDDLNRVREELREKKRT